MLHPGGLVVFASLGVIVACTVLAHRVCQSCTERLGEQDDRRPTSNEKRSDGKVGAYLAIPLYAYKRKIRNNTGHSQHAESSMGPNVTSDESTWEYV